MSATGTGPNRALTAEWEEDSSLPEALRRYWLGLLVAVVLGALSGYGLALQQPVRYATETEVLLRSPGASAVTGAGGLADGEAYVRQAARLAASQPVARRVVETTAGVLTLDDVREDYEVEAFPDRDSFVITVTADEPVFAVEFANAVAQAYRAQVRQENLQRTESIITRLQAEAEPLTDRLVEIEEELDDDPDADVEGERALLVARLSDLQNQQQTANLELQAFNDGVLATDPATLPERPVQPRPLRTAAAAALVSAVFAAGVAWWRNNRTQTAEERHDPARVLRAPLLGEVPDFSRAGITGQVPAASAPYSAAGEAYQFIVAALAYTLKEGDPTRLLVTSATPGDGKSVTTANLAVAAARDGRRVVVVDADARMRGLTALTEVEPTKGLAALADDDIPTEASVSEVVLGEGAPSVGVVPAGDGDDPAGFYRTREFRRAVERLGRTANLVILDTPPLLAVAETSAIAGQVDGIVLVVDRGTRLAVLEDVVERLDFIGTPLLGYIFNRGAERSGYGVYGVYGDARTR